MIDKTLYINKKEAMEMLNMGRYGINSIIERENWKIIKEKRDTYCLKEDVMNYKKLLDYIKEEYIFSGKYLSTKEGRQILDIPKTTFQNIAKLEKWKVVKKLGVNYYLKSDIMNYYEKNNKTNDFVLSEKYMSIKEVSKYLNVSVKSVYYIRQYHNWNTIKKDIDVFCLKSDVYNYKNNKENIEKNYILLKDTVSIFGDISLSMIQILAKKEKWNYIKYKNKFYYLKSDINLSKEAREKAKSNSIDYLNMKDSMIYMNMSKTNFNKFISKFNIKNYGPRNNHMYLKKQLDIYIKKREIWKRYVINKDEIKSKYNISNLEHILKKYNIFSENIPEYAVTKNLKNIDVFFREKDILKAIEQEKKAIEKEKKLTLRKKKILSNEFIELEKACIRLDLGNGILRKLLKLPEYASEIVNINKKKYIEIRVVEKISSLQLEFWNNHYSRDYYRKKSVKYKLKGIKPISIPLYAKTRKYYSKANNIAYKKADIDKLINGVTEVENSGYINKNQAMETLGLSCRMFNLFSNEYKLEKFNIFNTIYYLREDIDFFKEQQDEIGKNYITKEMVNRIYGDLNFIKSQKVTGFKIPSFCININKTKGYNVLYSRDDIEEYIKQKDFNNKLNSIIGSTEFETFIFRTNLLSDKLDKFNNSTYTKKRWFDYVRNKLMIVEKTSEKHRYTVLKGLIQATLEIEDLFERNNSKEIYKLSSNQINLWFKGILDERKRLYIYKFLEQVNEDIKLNFISRAEYNRKFIFSDIIKYDDRVFNKTNKTKVNVTTSDDIYEYDDYIKLFKHLINIKLHVKNSLIDINKKNSINYLSTWLYMLLHLNNGWRHGDVTTFPRLFLEDILESWNIESIDWFSDNILSTAKSRRIISRIIQYDFRISKTEVYGHFFCSDTLAPALATAILMIESYYKYNHCELCPEYDKPIMNFANSKFNEPTNSMINTCMRGSDLTDFKFSSRKMNRSVLTFVYNTVCSISPSGYNALILPKHLREHLDEMSTVQYIKFDEEALEFLSEELFERGQFGYVTDALLNLITDKIDERSARTNEIRIFNKLFGNIQKIEATVGMLNHFNNEEQEIIKLLSEYDYGECENILLDIYTNNMPAKQIDIQCLFSKVGCRFSEKNCVDCRYKIPSIYLLSTLCRNLKDDIFSYIEAHNLGKKIKLSSRIHHKVEIFMQATRKYGKEYVYNCIDMNREDFLKYFDRIPEVEDLMKLI